MLQHRAVYPPTLELLKEISAMQEAKEFGLAGGTSLALQIGHRVSVDLDFFSVASFDEEALLEKLKTKFNHIEILHQKKNSLNIVINNIRTDFIAHQYPLCNSLFEDEGINFFSMEDIAAMKLNAAASRGSKKDFVDIYFLLQHFSLSQMLEFMHKKYSNLNRMQVLLSLTYFEDAENDLLPVMLIPLEWIAVKDFLKEKVNELLK